MATGKGLGWASTVLAGSLLGQVGCGAQEPVPLASILRSDPQLAEVVSWLPPDTELVYFARGTRTLAAMRGTDAPGEVSTEHAMLTFLLIPFEWEDPGELEPSHDAMQLSLVVHSARAFAPAEKMESTWYEGCAVYCFARELTEADHGFLASLRRTPDRSLTVEGFEVSVDEHTEWGITNYWVVPRPDLLVWASDLRFLSQVLRSLRGADDDPDETVLRLPEWSWIDESATIAAIRHYDPNNADRDTTSPLPGQTLWEKGSKTHSHLDAGAKGFSLWLDGDEPNDLQIRYFTDSVQGAWAFSDLWGQPTDVACHVGVAGPDAYSIEFETLEGHESTVMLIVWSMLGLGVYI